MNSPVACPTPVTGDPIGISDPVAWVTGWSSLTPRFKWWTWDINRVCTQPRHGKLLLCLGKLQGNTLPLSLLPSSFPVEGLSGSLQRHPTVPTPLDPQTNTLQPLPLLFPTRQ
jgi:hypothetical protein